MYGIALNVACSRSTMVGIYRLAERAGQVCANVMIIGESGVGKEYLARQIHRFKEPAGKGFRVYHCHSSDIDFEEVKDLLHLSVTMGNDLTPVTIFFKSIDGINERDQLKLLQILEEEELIGLLEKTNTFQKPRLICSCERDPASRGITGLCQQLAYRLDVIHIEIPPLRERREEILPLANLFLQELKVKYRKGLHGFSSQAREELESYPWFGNVRELKNTIEKAVILSKDLVIKETYLN